MNKQTFHKGIIHLNDKVVVSDPCYELGVWCQIVLDDVLEGNYYCSLEVADMGRLGKRVASMEVVHADYFYDERLYYPEDTLIGVDAGMAGIYDYIGYKATHTDELDKKWYDYVIAATAIYGDTINGNGFVTNSGFGDGSYTCWVARNENDKVVAIEIEFIDEEDM